MLTKFIKANSAYLRIVLPERVASKIVVKKYEWEKRFDEYDCSSDTIAVRNVAINNICESGRGN
jgi:hypothetical protein